MCSYRKYPYPPQGRLMEMPAKEQNSRKFVAKSEFSGAWGRKSFHGRGMDIFWNNTLRVLSHNT